MPVEVRVPESAAGRRLDAFLASHPRVGSRSAAKRLIEAESVEVEGRRARPSRPVRAGEVIRFDLPADSTAALDPAPGIEVVHSDGWLAVLDKPAGLVVHPAPSHRGPTLVDALGGIGAGGDPARPGIVHRLDKDTSGLMIVARTEAAHRSLSAQVRRREVRREYLALVEGRLDSRTGTIDAPIGRDPARPTRMAVAGRAARDARTHFRLLEQLPGDGLVAVTLETGRTHQIRAHFAAIGHPVCGDPRYGTAGRHGLSRQFLHSTRIAFRHPDTGEELSFESDLPPDLRGALEVARKSR
jgi:23S rRNA pseudouridine1911/1915/1917 synthase